MFGLYQTFSCVGLFVFRPIVYKHLWYTFLVRFKYMKIWFFSLKFQGFPSNHLFLSLNLWFKVANLPPLSWNLLQVAWFPSILQSPKLTSSIISHFILRFLRPCCRRCIFTPNLRRSSIKMMCQFKVLGK